MNLAKAEAKRPKGRLLVTGCSGFIGRHAVRYALNNQYNVIGFDTKPPHIDDPGLSFVEGNINEKKAVEDAARGCDYILHLAAATSLPDFQYDLYTNYLTNIAGFMNAIEAAKVNNCRKFIYASSSAVYQKEYAETAIIDIMTQKNHYGRSKLIDDAIAASYNETHKICAVGLRYFNLYGPGEEVKERSSPVTQFLMSKKRDDTITIFGDGSQAKDFIHIDDAIALTFKLMESKTSSGVYNIGTGVSTSFLRIAELMHPKKIIHKDNPYLSSYIFYLKADMRRLLAEVKGYKFITIEEGISRLVKENEC